MSPTGLESFSFMTFSGEESDRFVRFARKVKATGQLPYVKVLGREPITSTDVVFEGFVKDSAYEGYIRYIVVETSDGKIFNVGGSNATKSIASEKVIFQEIPNELRSYRISRIELDSLLQQFELGQEDKAKLLTVMKRGLPFFDDKEKTLIVHFLKDYLKIPDVKARIEMVELLAMIGTPEIIEDMLLFLKDDAPEVRIEVTLRFRGLENQIKNSGEIVYGRCVGALIQALNDPNRDVRIYAAEDLGYMYNSDALGALIQSLSDDDDHVRWSTTIALTRIGSARVVPHLVRKILSDPYDRVRQSALLGLGRIGRAAYDQCPEVLEALAKTLKSGSDVAKSYAAFAFGQLGDVATSYIPDLVEALSKNNIVDIKSNAALALGKLADEIKDDQAQLISLRLSESLETGLGAESASPYYFWFLEYGGELSSSLELHLLASRFYETLGKRSLSWQAPYFKALSSYEQAEEFCDKGELEVALSLLERALNELRDCKGYPLDAQEGIKFRTYMIEARKYMIEGTIDWTKAVADEYIEAQKKFRDAYKVYATFSVSPTGPLQPKKRLTEREINFIATLKYMAWFGERFIEVELATIAGDIVKSKNLLSNIEVDIDRLYERISSSKTAYFEIFVEDINKKVDNMISTLRTVKDEISIIKIIRQGIDSIRQLYCSTPFPLPARMCPVVGLGVAKIGLRVTGASGGDGTSRSSPMFFPCDAKLVVTVDILVERRTRSGDRLIFSYTDREGKNVEADIPVFEGSYMLQLDYGIVQKSFEPLPYRTLLRFQGPDCEQMSDQRTLWIQAYDPQTEFLFPTVKDLKIDTEEARVVNVAVAQILCSEPNHAVDYLRYFYDEDFLSRGLMVFKKSVYKEMYDKFERIISQIKAEHPEVQLIAFPELCAPTMLNEELAKWSEKYKCYLIVGFEHMRNPLTHGWENTLHVFSPIGEGWQQPKNNPSSIRVGDKSLLENIISKSRPWIINKGKTAFGEIIVLHCSEVTTSNSASELTRALNEIAETDILILPSVSPSVSDFYRWVEFNLKRLYRCVIFANHAQFGGSAILSPKLDLLGEIENAKNMMLDQNLRQKTPENKSILPILPAQQEYYTVRQIDIFKIRHIRQTKAEDNDYMKSN